MSDDFEDYIEDIIEDIGTISDKYDYKAIIGRPRKWRNDLIEIYDSKNELPNVADLFSETLTEDPNEIKRIDLLISLFIGSINDIERVKDEIPEALLDKVKQKFNYLMVIKQGLFTKLHIKKRITIQGLSGTGKTELLLHKLKDLYTKDFESKIYFTCHNKILADNLRKRIPSFLTS